MQRIQVWQVEAIKRYHLIYDCGMKSGDQVKDLMLKIISLGVFAMYLDVY